MKVKNKLSLNKTLDLAIQSLIGRFDESGLVSILLLVPGIVIVVFSVFKERKRIKKILKQK